MNMKFSRKTVFKILIFIIFIFISSNFQESIVSVKAQSYSDISVNEAYSMINNTSIYPDLVVLDVRDRSEYNVNHICNAILIPVAELEYRIDELRPYNNTEIIVYCLSGGRSSSASQILVNNGFTKIFYMIGGINEWISSGYEVCPIENGQTDSPSTISFSFNFMLIVFLGSCIILIVLRKKEIYKK